MRAWPTMATSAKFVYSLTQGGLHTSRCTRNMSIDLSLERIRKLQAQLPAYTRPTCHITGTNGKGSVSALLSSIFRAVAPNADFTVGRFNSPHLISVNDSITLNDVPVSAEAYAAARARVVQADVDHAIGASSFELLTCTALNLFETNGADVVVLEVGMGGRLDATNVIPDTTVLVSAMTSVDLDHQAFLGGTVAAITREKAAIARPGRPFVLGQQSHPEVEPAAREVVGRAGGELLIAPIVSTREWDEELDGPRPGVDDVPPPPTPVKSMLPCFENSILTLLPLHGEHQLANLGVALGVISAIRTHAVTRFPWIDRLTPEAIALGVRNTRWPGRLSWHSVPGISAPVLVDGAHNAASARTLAAYIASLSATGRPLALTYLLALSSSPSKTPVQTLGPLLSLPADIAVAPLPFSPPEGMPWVHHEAREALVAAIDQLAPNAVIWEGITDYTHLEDPMAQLRSALDWARHRQEEKGGLIVVAGSLYLVADFYRLLGKEGSKEPRDIEL
ncbi:FolC bifunctional protein [Daedalea quercina L-15889]|uniref:FolC bifunctional protein n=1 Tax=Daedalea quercina L-15889 TaxID=1314783 RepID=A0A165LMP6_9APHY|nr:FolC bifunctional protein [Daedalea quercina L-15889]